MSRASFSFSDLTQRTSFQLFVGTVSLLILICTSWFIFGYVTLTNQQQAVTDNWRVVDNTYRDRFNAIPSLADSAKSLYQAEREIFDHLAKTRQAYALAGEPSYKAAAGTQLEQSLHLLETTMQTYPLGQTASISALQTQLDTHQANLKPVVNDYNQSVAAYNTSLETWPLSKVADMLQFMPAQPFVLAEDH